MLSACPHALPCPDKSGAEAKERDFKPLFLDTGLVSTSLGLSLPGLEMVDDLLMVNKGAPAEQFVGQHLLMDGVNIFHNTFFALTLQEALS